MKKYFLPVAVVFVLFSLYGCYTQVDFRDRHRDDYEYSHDQDRNENYSENDSDRNYDDESDVTVNNYYGGGYYPGYRRYLWHNYYPTFSIGYSYGPYWDTFCYDPWWYGYPVIAYYSPYYSPYYYNDYYYGGYYNNSNWNNGSVYKERTNSTYRLRNNDGGRGTATIRDRATRDLIQTSLNRENQRGESLKRDVLQRTRESSPVLRGRDNAGAGRDRTITPADRPARTRGVDDAVINKRGAEQPADRNREIIRRDKPPTNTDEARPAKPERRGDTGSPTVTPERKRESTSPSRENPRRRESSGSYSAPRRESSQPRYEAPRSSSGSSSRSSAPSRSSGSSSGGSRDRRR